MAKPQVTFMSPIDSPRMSHEQEGYDHLDDYEEEAYSANGCCCFRLFTFNLRRNNEREYDILNENGDHRDPWLVRKLKKVKEASEIVAGPKWKTFIRKIGAYIKKRKQRNNQAQYDAESYALNFDREEDAV
ncbi:hypothetical protein BDE02_06G164600 [Populus trichocarpa]|jgi:hypothetical protein|uniref:Uncharacterized protein n=1 Tax=Populus trichocarpa TaxID=3694 RepID=B9HAE3_POPTR|nr:hypothetical protein BDE02_06G164600 [Populus trichocarpa]|eukprot:XP_002308378.1 uncharacterized protein LOC7455656 [Populus trichocarpa]